MSIAQRSERLQIPRTLRSQLDDFRRRVWTVKTIEAICAAGFGVVAAFLAMFVLDRYWDTPGWPRAILFVLAALACAIVPLGLYRWVWSRRRFDQLARLLSRTHPRIGDQLLGVVELARDDSEQARSRQLVGAAIEQVAKDAQRYDFREAVPNPRHRLWLRVLAVPSVVTLGLLAFCPAAASNAWSRLVAPWKNTPRYTFAALDPIPDKVVIPHGEPFHFAVTLSKDSAVHPSWAEARVGDRPPVTAPLKDGGYEFELPSQVAKNRLELRVGDASRVVEVEPMLRPELNSAVSLVTLPDYLARPGEESKDVRGGSVSLIKGSTARFKATIGRDLVAAWVNGASVAPEGATITSQSYTLSQSRDVKFQWSDRFGLSGKEPFTLKLVARDDEAPTMMIEDLPRQKVVIDSELINFKVRARDDFGVKRVGLMWQGIDRKSERSVATGERALAVGGPDKDTLDVAGAFSAKSFGIEPQPLELRVFIEDYLPGRPRVISPPYTLYVLSADQHAAWLTEQLNKWHRQSFEVRDREMQLFEANKQFRELSAQDLDRPDTRKKLNAQASAEQANGRKLNNLVTTGEDLIKQAMRNPEFGVGHLERWAETLQVLKDVSGSRMPSVADLLRQAAQAPRDLALNSPADGKDGGNSSKDGNNSGKEGKNSGKDGNSSSKDGDSSSKDGSNSDKEGGGSSKDGKNSSKEGKSGNGGEGESSIKDSPNNPSRKDDGGGPTTTPGKDDPKRAMASGSNSGGQGKTPEKNFGSSPSSKSSNNAPKAGQMRAGGQPKPTEPPPGEPKPPTSVPSIVDGESRQQPQEPKKDEKPGPASPPKTPRFLLPNTTLTGGVKDAKTDPNAPPPTVQEKLDEALAQQSDLLAEFEKVADELNKILSNLEGSTLVKRLKAASRSQLAVAEKISDHVGNTFSAVQNRNVSPWPTGSAFEKLAAEEVAGSKAISYIMDDLSAYFERRRYARFKTVLDEMKQKDVVGALRQLGDDLKREQGLSIAQAEFWSDNLDRWAEDLVDPVNSGVCPGSKSKSSLPPSVVLEVLQILEGEVNLRDETRVADQGRPAVAAEEFGKQAAKLSKSQDGLKDRLAKVVTRIKELPDAEAEFGSEIGLLDEVSTVMTEASGILAKPDAGSPAIAAETDAIELLLKAKRVSSKGGGGGGGSANSPGGGGKGTTLISALALVGSGVNQKEVREDRGTPQATGDSGPALPDEFRAGLDQYFNKIEQRGPGGR